MKPFTTVAVLFLLQLNANFLYAQVPFMELNDHGSYKRSAQVEMQQLHADVKIYGNISTTTIKMVFYNGTGRIQEGRLTFPLPEGVSVTGFALDINGVLRKAVPVEKAKATAVFESIERRKVDPGILEKTEGNNFRTRVYPLPVNGTRTIEISYNQPLSTNGDNLYYYLPLAEKQVNNFSITTTVFDKLNMPSLVEKPDGGFIFEKKGNAWTASISKTNFTPKQALKIQIPYDNADPGAIIKKRPEGGYYFLASVNITPSINQGKKPSHITIVWDNSLSGLKRNHEAEKEFLKQYLQANPGIKVRLCGLSNKYTCFNDFTINDGNATELIKAIDAIVYDGATDYSLLHQFREANTTYLFFTDGLSNYGEAGAMPSNPVHTIVSAPVADFSKLKYISAATGGQFINLNQQSTQTAVQMVTNLPYRFLDIEQNDNVKDINPSRPVVANGSMIVTGIIDRPTQGIILLFGHGNAADKKVTVKIDPKNETTDWAIEKFWAQQKIDELEIFYEDNKSLIADLGKTYGIVTKNTSLIVLEDVEDYVKYKIVPPRELLTEYNRIIKERKEEQDLAWKDLLDDSKQMMKDLKTWWHTDFSDVTYKRKIKDAYREGEREFNVVTADSISSDGYFIALPPPPKQEMPAFTTPKVVADEEVREPAAVVDVAKGIVAVKSSELQEVVITKMQPKGKIITADIKSNAAYMKELESSNSVTDAYQLYLKLRNTYLQTPAFYFDVANWFFNKNETDRAVSILSNIAELELEDAELYKTMCYMLKKFGQNDKQLLLAKKVLNWRPMDPQSFRDYALALQDNGLYQNALDTLYTALTQKFTDETLVRDDGIEEVLLMEINNIISLHKQKLNITGIDKELVYDMPVDIRVALNWNMDNVDVDLHVTDPAGEECYYSNNRTNAGGRLSNDFTDGFGPEQFLLKKARKGRYKIQTNFFGENRVTAPGPSTLMAEIFLNYATGKQERKIVVFHASGTMAEGSDGKVYIGEFEF